MVVKVGSCLPVLKQELIFDFCEWGSFFNVNDGNKRDKKNLGLNFDLTAWSINLLSTCCSSMTKECNWLIISMSVMPFCHWQACRRFMLQVVGVRIFEMSKLSEYQASLISKLRSLSAYVSILIFVFPCPRNKFMCRVPKCDVIKFLCLQFSIFMTIF